jgi:hypothetical protein
VTEELKALQLGAVVQPNLHYNFRLAMEISAKDIEKCAHNSK